MANDLKNLDVANFDVNAGNCGAAGASTGRWLEPSAAMRGAHEEVAYTNWLKAEIQNAIDDWSPTVTHLEAMKLIRGAIKKT